jgi:adenylate kinase
MADQNLKRVVGIYTSSKFKVCELASSFSLYGIDVVQINPESENESPIITFDRFLRSGNPKLKIMCGIVEQTNLYKRETTENASKKHLELVTHESLLTVYYIRNNIFAMQCYKETTDGYIDLKKKSDSNKKYDWDDIFVVDNMCHLSYRELANRNIKISSRDKNISAVIKQFVHYKEHVDLVHNPQHYESTIDFSKDVSKYVSEVKEFNTPYMQKIGLNNIITVALNQGMFFRSALTRRQKLYWCPGLNAGIPFTPKPKDRIHEITYQMHDFSHFNIPDLVFDGFNGGSHSPIFKKVYIIYRLISEAVTLVLADMIFVNSVIKSGIKYENVQYRKIYPIFQQIEKKNPDINENLHKYIYEILSGSVQYCFHKNNDIWGKNMDDRKALLDFSNKYDPYFIDDFKWTFHNYEYMVKSATIYEKWWNAVKDWRKYGVNLELQSVGEFITDEQLTLSDHLITDIFDCVYKKYISRIFTNKHELDSFENRTNNAFIRYMMGQSLIFFRFEHFPDSKPVFAQIDHIMKDKINQETINNIRTFYNNYLLKLERANLITPDDRINYEQVCPIFSPLIVNYSTKEELSEEFVNNILN